MSLSGGHFSAAYAKDGSPKAKGTGLKKGGFELDGPAQLIYPVCDDIPLICVIHT